MRSPLAARAADLARVAETTGGEVVLEHVPFLAQVDLRLAADDAGRAPYPLPLEPNTAWEDGPRAALWLGPDEWLIIGRPGDGAAIVSELEAALAGVHHSVVDVGANRVALELSGPRSKEVLSKGCSLDLDPRGRLDRRPVRADAAGPRARDPAGARRHHRHPRAAVVRRLPRRLAHRRCRTVGSVLHV